MRNKKKPCHCGEYQKIYQYGLTDKNYVRHTWVDCYPTYQLGA